MKTFCEYVLDTILSNSDDIIYIKDVNLKYITASASFIKMVGLDNINQIVGKTDFDFFEHDLALKYVSDDKTVFSTEKSLFNVIEPIPSDNGRKKYVSTSKHLIRDEQGTPFAICGWGADVTSQFELVEQKQLTRLSRQMFDDVLEADLTRNLLWHTEGSLLVTALALPSLTSFDDGVDAFAQSYIHKDFRAEYKELYSREKLIDDYNKGNKTFSHITLLSNDGQNFKWIRFSNRLYTSKTTNTIRMLTFLKDSDQDIKSRQQLEHSADTDELTGLLNRKSITEKIDECISTYGKKDRHAMLFIDLDSFKSINDHFGHLFADNVLKETARKFHSTFRNNDLVGRIGGDEFLVFMKNVNSIQSIKKKLDTLMKAPLFSYSDGKLSITMTCSIGVSIYDGDGKDFKLLYSQADKAMYKVKNSGKNNIAFYDNDSFID
ncbi:MAG: GGDEF domain-containing protein [Oscillospiraceae bacterium]